MRVAVHLHPEPRCRRVPAMSARSDVQRGRYLGAQDCRVGVGGAGELLQARELPRGVLRDTRWGRHAVCYDSFTAGVCAVWQGRGVHQRDVRGVHAMRARRLQGSHQHRAVRALPGKHLCRDRGLHGPEPVSELPGQVLHAGRDGSEQQASMRLRQGVLPHHQPGRDHRRGAVLPDVPQGETMHTNTHTHTHTYTCPRRRVNPHTHAIFLSCLSLRVRSVATASAP